MGVCESTALRAGNLCRQRREYHEKKRDARLWLPLFPRGGPVSEAAPTPVDGIRHRKAPRSQAQFLIKGILDVPLSLPPPFRWGRVRQGVDPGVSLTLIFPRGKMFPQFLLKQSESS
jgi:hypothetical protein